MSTALESQLLEIEVDRLKAGFDSRGSSADLFLPDAEIAGAIADGGERPKITHSAPDRVVIYSMIDGTPSNVLVYMLAKKMKIKLPGGRPAWTTDPRLAPPRHIGTSKCFLHAESDIRDELLTVGLNVINCPKSNLPGQWAQEEHARTKHKREWGAILRARELAKEKEIRDLSKAHLAAVVALASPSSPAIGVSGPSAAGASGDTIFRCEKCPRFFDTRDGLAAHGYKAHPSNAGAA